MGVLKSVISELSRFCGRQRFALSPAMWLVLFMGLGLRLWVCWTTPAPSQDGAMYLLMARDFPQGPQWSQTYMHPLYPALLGMLGRGEQGVNYLWIGRGVNLVAEGVNLVLIARLGQLVLGPWGGVMAAMLYAVSPQPVDLTAEVMTEPIYLILILCVLLWLLYPSGQRWHGYEQGFTLGALACVGYFIRPEGLMLAVLCCAWCVWRYRTEGTNRLWQMAGCIDAVLLCFLIVWFTGGGFSRYVFTPKADIILPQAYYQAGLGDFRDLDGVMHALWQRPWLVIQKVVLDFPRLLKATIQMSFYPLFVFSVWGVFVRRRFFSLAPFVVLAWWFCLHLGMMLLLIIEKRLTIAILPVLLMWAAAGLLDVYQRLDRYCCRTVAQTFLIVVFAVCVGKCLRAPSPDRAYQQEVARAVLSDASVKFSPKDGVVTDMPHLALYLEGTYVPMRSLRYQSVPDIVSLMAVRPNKVMGWERADWEAALSDWEPIDPPVPAPDPRYDPIQWYQPTSP